MKTEVLQSIKKTEEESRSLIQAAREQKAKMLADARIEAENLIAKETEGAEEYKAKRISDAHAEAVKKSAVIIAAGEQQAASVRADSKKNLEEAVDQLVNHFKVKLNV
ncbi:ATPase [Methanogenium sp. MK-MG]|uniref:ATPase n=1 Tax=Methanogenium sp. MK-MG TaxID=2599926 RepID=UPI0013EC5095|nr:ATPase [Methanogenium sp. MK-MG]KAF1077223.1 hypothetical protein MKMG_01349 [Methanogenium sp. MK-MG]